MEPDLTPMDDTDVDYSDAVDSDIDSLRHKLSRTMSGVNINVALTAAFFALCDVAEAKYGDNPERIAALFKKLSDEYCGKDIGKSS